MQSSAIGVSSTTCGVHPLRGSSWLLYAAPTVRAALRSGVGPAIATFRSRPSLRASCGVSTSSTSSSTLISTPSSVQSRSSGTAAASAAKS